MYKNLAVALVVALAPAAAQAPGLGVRVLVRRDLPAMDGQQLTGDLTELVLQPGFTGGAHKHNYGIYAYILEGAVISQLDSEKPVTYTKGQVFFESPGQLHALFKNPSRTESAKVLVFHIGEKSKPITIPAR